MSKTLNELKNLKDAVVEDAKVIGGEIREMAEEVKDATIEASAATTLHIKEQGGIANVVKHGIEEAADTVGQGVGYAHKGGQAVLNALGDVETEIEESVAKHYEQSEIDPAKVGARYRTGADNAINKAKGLGRDLGKKAMEGKVSLVKDFQSRMPSEEEYKVTIGEDTYKIKRTLTRRGIEGVKKYMAEVGEALPADCKIDKVIYECIAREGIQSNTEFHKKDNDLFECFSRYSTLEKK